MADRRAVIGIAVLAALGLVAGWRTFWFLTDDAFIAFRYVSNSVLGHGYVWNPPPFRPVDGYTSFSWVALLDLTWRTTGVKPPQAANVLSLAFAAGQVALLFAMVLRLRLRHDTLRLPLLAVAVVGVLTNRTFLAWTSSGLETAMFNFVLLAWVYLAGWRGTATARDCGWLVGAAVLLALTRPDGLLYVAATGAILAASALSRPTDRARIVAPAMCGVGVLALFFGWRMAVYGFLLPNTYYAKVVGYRPGLGLRYLGSFVLEYGLWWWLVLVGAASWAWMRARPWAGQWSLARVCRVLALAAPALTVVAHAAYYTFVVGGDHFEYRVFSQLVPLCWVVVVWAVDRLELPRARVLAAVVGLVLLSWPLPWVHWAHTKDLDTRESTVGLRHEVAPHLPGPVRWYGRWFDALQEHLISHMTCMRHQEHKVFYEFKQARLPDRAAGEAIAWDGFPVHVSGEVGYVGWVLPNVAIVDAFGLNDYYVARNSETVRQMTAHSRTPPPGYLEAFRANVGLRNGRWHVSDRDPPLSEQDIDDAQRMYDVWLLNLR